MIAQGILPFKLERTDELITPRSGLALFAEVMRSLKVREKIEGHFPCPGSNRGYDAWEYIEPLLLMMEGGGRHVEDLREIEEDRALRTLVGMRRMPSTSTVGDWLLRMGAGGGVEAMRRVDEETAAAIGRRLAVEEYTLDVDATVIESEKKEARWTYKKVRGFSPCWAFWRSRAENLIKELKIGLGMEQMTSGDFRANALWFAIGVLAYNLTQATKLLFLGGEWVKKTVATLRWQLIETAGRLVRHGRCWVLRIAAPLEKLRLYLQVRSRCRDFCPT